MVAVNSLLFTFYTLSSFVNPSLFSNPAAPKCLISVFLAFTVCCEEMKYRQLMCTRTLAALNDLFYVAALVPVTHRPLPSFLGCFQLVRTRTKLSVSFGDLEVRCSSCGWQNNMCVGKWVSDFEQLHGQEVNAMNWKTYLSQRRRIPLLFSCLYQLLLEGYLQVQAHRGSEVVLLSWLGSYQGILCPRYISIKEW